jgi:hypothetical protein
MSCAKAPSEACHALDRYAQTHTYPARLPLHNVSPIRRHQVNSIHTRTRPRRRNLDKHILALPDAPRLVVHLPVHPIQIEVELVDSTKEALRFEGRIAYESIRRFEVERVYRFAELEGEREEGERLGGTGGHGGVCVRLEYAHGGL